MADKKTELMAQFYAECQQKGYTDMADDTQSLKAKVIATDLGLNYGNIIAFYENAKYCYERLQTEKEQAQKRQQLQQKKEAQERARRQVDGELLVTLAASSQESADTTSVRVYIRPDKSIYSTVNNGSKIEGAPKISIEQGGALLLTYHPSKAVYTGATVGGITTGGVHYTQSGYTASKTHSGKGDINISVGSSSFTLQLVKMSEHTCNLFKRDILFTSLVHNKEIKCFVESDTANFYYESIKTGGLDHQTMMNALSIAADEQRLSYAMCEKITHLLGRIVHGQFPPSDEEIYNSAKALASSSTSAELSRAIALYESISDYKDAAELAQTAKEKAILEKERAILEKEARAKKNKRTATILIPIITVLIVAAAMIITPIKKNADYERALSLVESRQYEDAIKLFSALGDYKDSAKQMQIAETAMLEEQKAKAYAEAIALMEAGKYDEAHAVFDALGDYKDSQEWLKQFQKMRVKVEYSYGDGKGYVAYYDYTANGKILTYWSDDAKQRTEYFYNDEGVLIQVKQWNYKHLVNGEPSYYLIDFDANGIPVKYEDTANDIIVEYDHVFAEDGYIKSITYTRSQYSGRNTTRFNIMSATFDFSFEDKTYFVDKQSMGNYLNAFSSNSVYKRYWISVFEDAVDIYEVGNYELDEHGNIIKASVRGGIFNEDGGWVNEYTVENTYDNDGDLIKVVEQDTKTHDTITYEYTYEYIYCPDAT